LELTDIIEIIPMTNGAGKAMSVKNGKPPTPFNISLMSLLLPKNSFFIELKNPELAESYSTASRAYMTKRTIKHTNPARPIARHINEKLFIIFKESCLEDIPFCFGLP
jgi:hypothetical protein